MAQGSARSVAGRGAGATAAAPRPSPDASHQTEVRVRFGETDLMGIAHHASYVSYFEVGRVEWLRRRGITPLAWAEQGVHMAVVQLSLRYASPARFDDLLSVTTTLESADIVTVTFVYDIRRSGALVAEGSTRLACVDGRQKLQRLPPHALAALLEPPNREGGPTT
jgi:acyl-CoA thioester hydrolase